MQSGDRCARGFEMADRSGNHWTLKRPSPALVVACLALFVAGAGSATAARDLIGGKQIKNGSIELKDLSKKARKALRRGAKAGKRGPAGSDAQFNGAAAGGDLTGAYPNPSIAAGAITPTKIGNVPAARVFNTANESFNSGLEDFVTFNSERFDTAGLHSTTANTQRLTAPIAGVYLVSGSAVWFGNDTGMRRLGIRLNGALPIAADAKGTPGGGFATEHAVSTTYALAAGDWVELRAVQTSGAPLSLAASQPQSPEFSITWLGPSS